MQSTINDAQGGRTRLGNDEKNLERRALIVNQVYLNKRFEALNHANMTAFIFGIESPSMLW
jgi:hypothetical protein